MEIACFQIEHHGCWGSAIGLAFPDAKLSSVDCRWIKGKVAHVVRAEGVDAKEIVSYFKKRKDVKKVEVLDTGDVSYVRTITDTSTTQFSYLFFEHNCVPIAPVRFEGKYEIWTLGTTEKKNIERMYKYLKKRWPTKLLFSKKEPVIDQLTEKQRQVITYAHHFGYFDWPRKKSATEIAALVRIPKTVFLSHLRKAENKIMKKWLVDHRLLKN